MILLIPQRSGIYQILNKINGKFYIGSAINLLLRWCQHKYDLNLDSHDNSHLQRAWNKYGPEAFEFKVLEQCNRDVLEQHEQFWIDWLKACELGYNQRKQAHSNIGIKWTQEHKDKISNTKKGVLQSEEAIQARSLGLRKLEKWPHMLGCKCKCRECLDRLNDMNKSYRKPKERMRYKSISVTEGAPTLDIVEPKVKKK